MSKLSLLAINGVDTTDDVLGPGGRYAFPNALPSATALADEYALGLEVPDSYSATPFTLTMRVTGPTGRATAAELSALRRAFAPGARIALSEEDAPALAGTIRTAHPESCETDGTGQWSMLTISGTRYPSWDLPQRFATDENGDAIDGTDHSASGGHNYAAWAYGTPAHVVGAAGETYGRVQARVVPAQASESVLLSCHPLAPPTHWADEFSGTGIDADVWRVETIFNAHHVAGELQYYNWEDVNVAGGQCVLSTRQVTANGYDYQSGIISSGSTSGSTAASRKAFGYGYYEMRAQVPATKGILPAFWLSNGVDLEIDVAEILGSSAGTCHHTIHVGGVEVYTTSVTLPSGLYSDAYHIFAVDWQPGYVRFFVDGVKTGEYRASISAGPCWIVANTAVGHPWEGLPDATSVFPQYYRIDWIRAREGAAAGFAPTQDYQGTADTAALSGQAAAVALGSAWTAPSGAAVYETNAHRGEWTVFARTRNDDATGPTSLRAVAKTSGSGTLSTSTSAWEGQEVRATQNGDGYELANLGVVTIPATEVPAVLYGSGGDFISQRTGTSAVAIGPLVTPRPQQTITLACGWRVTGVLLKGSSALGAEVYVNLLRGTALVAGQTLSVALPATAGEFAVAFDEPYVVPETGVYTLMVDTVGASGTLYKSVANPYSGGALNGSATDDLYFAVLGQVPATFDSSVEVQAKGTAGKTASVDTVTIADARFIEHAFGAFGAGTGALFDGTGLTADGRQAYLTTAYANDAGPALTRIPYGFGLWMPPGDSDWTPLWDAPKTAAPTTCALSIAYVPCMINRVGGE